MALSSVMDCQDPVQFIPANLTDDSTAGKITRSHAIAMHGEPKYEHDFDHFDYVNPNAHHGGRITLANRGTFDSFHPYIEKGNSASTGSIETLTTQSDDEAFTQYGLIAEAMEWPDDRSWITFFINKRAKWHDGKPITADDVIWTFHTLVEKGQPFFRYYYSDVSDVVKGDDYTVTFRFSTSSNRELPLIMGQLPVLPKHYWKSRDFTKPTLEPPLGSGPYQVKQFEPGRYVTLQRVDNYWGKNLPVRRGFNNFDQQHIKFYRDDTAIRLALKAGESDLRFENQAKAWALDYNINAVEKGWLVKHLFTTSRSQGMQAFIMNLRRPLFQNKLVREALDYAFDFEWSNTNLFFTQYKRTESYWPNSELAARGNPKGEEKDIIAHYRECLPDAVDQAPYSPPTTDGLGWARGNIEKAAEALKKAGYVMQDFKLVHEASGEPLRFEILYSSPNFERIILPYVRTLAKLGIQASARIVDQSQYVTRLRAFDFDIIWNGWLLSDSPGNELRDFFSSAAADNPASRNYAGIKNPVIDQIIELVIASADRQQLVERTRALDRVLLANRFVVPNWHLPATRVVYWDKFGIPKITPASGPIISTWWIDGEKQERLDSAMRDNRLIDDDQQTANLNNSHITGSSIAHGIDKFSDFDWLSTIFPIMLLTLELLLLIRIHRFLNRGRRAIDIKRNSEVTPPSASNKMG